MSQNKEFTTQLAKLARNPSVQLRILFADPESPIVKERAYSLDINHSDLSHRIYKARAELSSVIEPGSPLLREIRTFSDVLIPYSMLRVDNRMIIVPYLASKPKAESPAFVVEGEETELFQKYQRDFEHVWELSQPLHNRRVFVPSIYTQLCSEKGLIEVR